MPAIRRYQADCFKVPDYQFGLIWMIGGYLDADMQYDQVSEKLAAYKYEHLPKAVIKAAIMECSSDDENDSDFEDDTPLRHPEDF